MVDTLWGYSLVYEMNLLIMLYENAELNNFNSSVHTQEAVRTKLDLTRKSAIMPSTNIDQF